MLAFSNVQTTLTAPTLRLLPTPGSARWTLRASVFALALTVVAIAAHRFGSMPTLTAVNLVVVSAMIAAVAIILGLISAAVIWREGRTGAIRVSLGIVIAAGLLSWPVAFLQVYRTLPRLNDVTTDTNAPPNFTELAKERGLGMNPATYNASFAALQAETYPDLRPMLVERPAEETFEVVRDALLRQKLTIVREQPPEGRPVRPGIIEAVDRTMVLGFYDDVAIRVDGDSARSRIDLRSASRFGLHDLGRNAERTRRLMREIVARLEATVPTATGERFQRRRLLTKKALETVQKSKALRKLQDASRGGARGEPEPRERQRPR